ADALRGLGLCASREALDALLAHATKSRLSPAEVVEHIVRLERRERDARNLASRTKRATLGAMKPLDRFDWSFPGARAQRPSSRTERCRQEYPRSEPRPARTRDGKVRLLLDRERGARRPAQ